MKSLERDTADARTALAHLALLAGGAFADLAPDRRRDVAATFKKKKEGGASLFALNRVVLLCTYRDDRVMPRWAGNHARRSRRAMSSNRGIGRCLIRCGSGRRCGGK